MSDLIDEPAGSMLGLGRSTPERVAAATAPMTPEEVEEIQAHVKLHGSIPTRFTRALLAELDQVKAKLSDAVSHLNAQAKDLGRLYGEREELKAERDYFRGTHEACDQAGLDLLKQAEQERDAALASLAEAESELKVQMNICEALAERDESLDLRREVDKWIGAAEDAGAEANGLAVQLDAALARVEYLEKERLAAEETAARRLAEACTALAEAKKAAAERDNYRLNHDALGKSYDHAIGDKDAALAEAKALREALVPFAKAYDPSMDRVGKMGARFMFQTGGAPEDQKSISPADLKTAHDTLAAHPEPAEDFERCPSHSAGLQCCNLEGHVGAHEWRDGPLDNLQRVGWPREPKR